MDNYDAGRLCGELVREAMPDGGKLCIFVGRLEQDVEWSTNAGHRRVAHFGHTFSYATRAVDFGAPTTALPHELCAPQPATPSFVFGVTEAAATMNGADT